MRTAVLVLCGLALLSAGFLTACGGKERPKRLRVRPITMTVSRTHNGSTMSQTYTIETIVLPAR